MKNMSKLEELKKDLLRIELNPACHGQLESGDTDWEDGCQSESYYGFIETAFLEHNIIPSKLDILQVWEYILIAICSGNYVLCADKLYNILDLELLYGKYEKEGCKYYCVQDAYIDRAYWNTEIDVFMALAIDAEGNEYYLYWDIVNPDTEDASECCDWTKFTARAL